MPRHIAIIMDGNRRWAQAIGEDPKLGHKMGRDKLEELLEWCLEMDVKYLTVFAFSSENFSRDLEEVHALMELFTKNFHILAKDERVHKNQIRVRVLGNIDMLPQELQDAINLAMDQTKDYSNYQYSIALAYGGRQEIVEAVQNICRDVKEGKIEIEDINEKLVSSYLYTDDIPDPDLIFRTSGEERISNFLLWQSAYSELYFSDVYWPGLKKTDFLKAIYSYQRRKRRWGE